MIMSDFIDELVIVNIVSRLPVESVLQCRCVCKRWRDLLHDLYFTQIHTDRLTQQQQQQEPQIVSFFTLVEIPNTNACELHMQDYYVANDDDDDNVAVSSSSSSPKVSSISRPLHPPVLLIGDHDGYKGKGIKSLFQWFIIGTANGLICLYGNYGYTTLDYYNAPIIIVYNPITKEHLIIPTDDESLCIKDNVSYMISGFGYHPRTNEYKIVRIIHQRTTTVHYFRWIQVYTLGSGGKWRIYKLIVIQTQIQTKPCGDSLGLAFNGAIYWLSNYKLFCFDLEDEVLRNIPRPPMSCGHSYVLVVLAECLCMIEDKTNIWMMNNHNNTTTAKKYSKFSSMQVTTPMWKNYMPIWRNISILEHRAIAFTSRGRVLFLYKRRSLVSFDPRTETRESLGDFPSFEGRWYHVMSYTKSLVSLKALGEEDAKMIERPIQKKKTNTTKRRRSRSIDMNKQMIKLFTSLLLNLFAD